jgi:hypothetical protein
LSYADDHRRCFGAKRQQLDDDPMISWSSGAPDSFSKGLFPGSSRPDHGTTFLHHELDVVASL